MYSDVELMQMNSESYWKQYIEWMPATGYAFSWIFADDTYYVGMFKKDGSWSSDYMLPRDMNAFVKGFESGLKRK